MGKHSTKSKGRSWWAAQLKAFESSGMSQRAFCKQRALSYSTFAKWRRRIREEGALVVSEAPRFIEVELPVESKPLVRLVVGTLTVDFETLPPPGWFAQLAALEAERC